MKFAEKVQSYTLKYYTSGPVNRSSNVAIVVDSALDTQQIIQAGKPYSMPLKLKQGEHNIELTIDGKFNPKILGMSQDDREIGVNYQIIKDEVGSG